ncbi:hypothetical protein GCM10020331_091610 [Ectobacillus funiculus]
MGLRAKGAKDMVGAELCDQCEASRLTSDGGGESQSEGRGRRGCGRVATRTTGQAEVWKAFGTGGHADQDAAPRG